MIPVRIKRISPQANIPQAMSSGASGYDVRACLEYPMIAKSGERVSVPTGFQVEIPPGFEIQVRPRSGLAFKKGLTVVNAPGTIDSDYRGEVRILLVNLSDCPVTIEPGDRIAQLVLQEVKTIVWQESNELSGTTRNTGGFGSTG